MPRWLRFVHSLRWPLSVLIVLAMGLFAWYALPMKEVLTGGYTGVVYYRGLGLTSGSGTLGKRFYAADFWVEYEEGSVFANYHVRYPCRDGGCFTSYYKNGKLAGEGDFPMWLSDEGTPQFYDWWSGTWAKYYRPDGTLGSEVIDGSGLHIWWTPDGEKVEEIKMDRGKICYITWWYPSGQLRWHRPFKDGVLHGESKYYWPNGGVSDVATFEHGSLVRPVISYNEDGSMKKNPRTMSSKGGAGASRPALQP